MHPNHATAEAGREEAMPMRIRSTLFCVCALLLVPDLAGAKQAAAKLPASDDEMVKVVFRSRRPGLPAGHTDTKPKTLYRVGERWGRLEHPDNPLLHPLVIVASPDVWVVDLRRQVARHSLDPGPRYVFRAPIVDRLAPDLPHALLDFEFGRELEFMEARGAKPNRVEEKGLPLDVYETGVEGVRVAVAALADTRQVRSVLVYRGKQAVIAAYLYDEYRRMPAEPALFALPDGVRVVQEAGVEGSEPRDAAPVKARR